MKKKLGQSLNIIASIILILIISYIWIQNESIITKKFKEQTSTDVYIPLSMVDLTLLRNKPAISEFYLIISIMQFVSDTKNTELIAKELYTGYKADPYIKETIFFSRKCIAHKKRRSKDSK